MAKRVLPQPALPQMVVGYVVDLVATADRLAVPAATIEDAPRFRDIDRVFRVVLPRQLDQPVERFTAAVVRHDHCGLQAV